MVGQARMTVPVMWVSSAAASRGVGVLIRLRAQHQPVAEAHVDGGERAIEQGISLLELRQPIERGDLVAFRQQHVGTVAEMQVPAPLGDSHGGDDTFLQIGSVAQCIDQRRRADRRAWTDHERELAEFGDVLVRDHLAGPVDQDEPALVLPDGERATLLQNDDDGAGKAALDGGVFDPGQGLQALARHAPRRSRESDRRR